MAQEFGGAYSPHAQEHTPQTQPATVRPKRRIRARLMFFAPLPLLFTGFGQITAGNPTGIVQNYGAFVLLILAAWLLTEGQKAQAAFDGRKSARRPAFPRKIFAAVLSGLGIGLATYGAASAALMLSLVLALLATGLHLIAFGLDPLKNKETGGFDGLANRRVAQAVAEAEAHISTMLDAISALKDRHLKNRVQKFANAAQAMFTAVEQDPRDLTAARKYLGVYLMGARDATVKFTDLYHKTKDPGARADYEALLADLEASFDAQRQEMLLDDQTDLDVEIEVLRERLRAEGV